MALGRRIPQQRFAEHRACPAACGWRRRLVCVGGVERGRSAGTRPTAGIGTLGLERRDWNAGIGNPRQGVLESQLLPSPMQGTVFGEPIPVLRSRKSETGRHMRNRKTAVGGRSHRKVRFPEFVEDLTIDQR